MASQRYIPLTVILIIICLDISSVVGAVATIVRDPKISRYDSYNLEKGPVFYEAYYPDYSHDGYQEKRNLDRNRQVLETSFQVPFTYSAKTDDISIADRPVSIIFNNDENRQTANIEEISKLVKRVISRDLENWNILERYLDRVSINQNSPMQQRVYSRDNNEDNNYPFQDNRQQSFDLSRQPNLEILQKSEARDAKQRPNYFREIEGNTMIKKLSDVQVADASSIDVASGLLFPENIFQPRPQIIRYTFFKKPTLQLDQAKKAIDNSTPKNYGDNLIHQEIAEKNNQIEGNNVKVTSIEVSELPRHKTRHHHGEWPKRDSILRHVSEEKKNKDA